MGSMTRTSSSILKLVHPGRLVEMHTKSITAAEVMRKHPRHCVARPDVFKNPWVVVRPESVLLPGSVFYVVPFHTLRRLMRSDLGPHKNMFLHEEPSRSFADVADFRAESARIHRALRNEDSFGSKQSETAMEDLGLVYSGRMVSKKQYPDFTCQPRNRGGGRDPDESSPETNNATELKSCLKKPKDKGRNPRVTFKLPGEES